MATSNIESAFGKLKEQVDQLQIRLEKVEKTGVDLRRDTDGAMEAAGKALDNAASAHAMARDSVKTSSKAQTAADAAKVQAKKAEATAGAAKKAAVLADAKAANAQREVDHLQRILGPGNHIKSPGDRRSYPYLNIPVPDTEFDRVIRGALDKLKYDNRPADLHGLADKIVKSSLASCVERVTQHLGRARISDTRRHILAAIYPHMLEENLKDDTDPKKLDAKKLGDPPAFARNLLIELDSSGYLDDFAELVAEKSETDLSVKLSHTQKEALKKRVRESV
jgi:hypothetical protein